ncbi:MAG: hypothetical protein HON23_02380, partial [Rickettsiales bacterium]|nr:hypothetical protein [Rickettsiales bacterium]
MAEVLRRGLCYILSFILSVGQVPLYAASEIVVDQAAASANQARLDKAHNDVTIVNISGNLSSAGVSHNKFTKFDIG